MPSCQFTPCTDYFNPRHPYGWRLRGIQYLCVNQDFNPRHPYGWRPEPAPAPAPVKISIHATHTGGDRHRVLLQKLLRDFNPRHPYGWRLLVETRFATFYDFNPRHPYGWRLSVRHDIPRRKYFNPRHPYGWRRYGPALCRLDHTTFQSTPPIRVATKLGYDVADYDFISIHATHTGGDKHGSKVQPSITYFNPRHPYGWRRSGRFVHGGFLRISIHATHTGGDCEL